MKVAIRTVDNHTHRTLCAILFLRSVPGAGVACNRSRDIQSISPCTGGITNPCRILVEKGSERDTHMSYMISGFENIYN